MKFFFSLLILNLSIFISGCSADPVSIEKSMMNSELGFCRKILTILEQNGVSFENMPSGIDTVSVVISDSNLKNKTEIIGKSIFDFLDSSSIPSAQKRIKELYILLLKNLYIFVQSK